MAKRDYSSVSGAVREHYRTLREKQTVEYVDRMHARYSEFSEPRSWPQLFEDLGGFIDVSDPDISLPNDVHLFQTAEAMRRDGLPDWMQVVGLVHDIGKCMHLNGCDEDGTSVAQQWGCVGDTFVTGHPLPPGTIFPEFDSTPRESIYDPGCGLRNVRVSFGHDEWLYRVLSPFDLPQEALYIIRFHSLYPWHSEGAYTELEDALDRRMKPLVQQFNRYDLYTKENTPYTAEQRAEMMAYYAELIGRFLPPVIMI
jgi:inositol oxygenase